MAILDTLLEKNVLPDFLIRIGIRRLLEQRRREIMEGGTEARQERLRAFIADMAASPIAVATQESKEQHYEVPTRFYELSLGPHLKYSSAYWDNTTPDLGAAEEKMLGLWHPDHEEQPFNYSVLRALSHYYLRERLIGAILTSKRMPKGSKTVHLKVRRKMLRLLSFDSQ